MDMKKILVVFTKEKFILITKTIKFKVLITSLKRVMVCQLNMFLDSQIYPFKLKCLGREVIRSKYGKINTVIFRPIVQSGRIFKEQESVTIWITDDQNKIPIKLRASLAVGSLRAELEDFSGLASPLMLLQRQED